MRTRTRLHRFLREEEMETIMAIMSKIGISPTDPRYIKEEERTNTVRSNAGPSYNKAKQASGNRGAKQSYKPRCSNHGHDGTEKKGKIKKLTPEQHSNSRKMLIAYPDDDLSHPQHPYHNT